MDKKSRLYEESPTPTNSLALTVDDRIKPYKKVDAIIIPDNATNGDMMKLMFPDAKNLGSYTRRYSLCLHFIQRHMWNYFIPFELVERTI